MQKTIKSFLEKVIKKTIYAHGDYKKGQKIERDVELKLNLARALDAYKVDPPSNYHQKTDDFLENLRLYEQALERLKGKYKPHILDTQKLMGEDLLRREIKREHYCEKYKLTAKELDLIITEVNKKASEEVELAQLNIVIRDGNYTKQELCRAIQLEGEYGSPIRVRELEKNLEALEKKGASRKPLDYAKRDFSINLRYNIAYNVSVLRDTPTEDKFLINWRKKLDLLKENLKAKGIYLDKKFEADLKYEHEIKKTWREISEQFEKQRAKDLGFEKFYEEIDRKYPRFDFAYFTKDLLRSYSDGRLPHMSSEKFDKTIRIVYAKQTEEYQKRRPLAEQTMDAKKYIKHKVDQTKANQKTPKALSKSR